MSKPWLDIESILIVCNVFDSQPSSRHAALPTHAPLIARIRLKCKERENKIYKSREWMLYLTDHRGLSVLPILFTCKWHKSHIYLQDDFKFCFQNTSAVVHVCRLFWKLVYLHVHWASKETYNFLEWCPLKSTASKWMIFGLMLATVLLITHVKKLRNRMCQKWDKCLQIITSPISKSQ